MNPRFVNLIFEYPKNSNEIIRQQVVCSLGFESVFNFFFGNNRIMCLRCSPLAANLKSKKQIHGLHFDRAQAFSIADEIRFRR